MPTEWSFMLEVDEPMRVHRNDVHALLSVLFDTTPEGDDSASAAVDHSSGEKAYRLRGAHLVGDHLLRLQVALLDDTLPDSERPGLIHSLRAGLKLALFPDAISAPTKTGDEQPLRLGRQPFRAVIRQVGARRDQVVLEEAASWGELLDSAPRQTAALRFLDTTTFRHGQHYLPYPLPAQILASLERMWHRWCPVPDALPASFAPDEAGMRAVEAVVLDSDIRNCSEKWRGGRRLLGFDGSVSIGLAARQPDADLGPFERSFATLLEFARFAGVGSGTTHGFGVVELSSGTRRSSGQPDDERLGWHLARVRDLSAVPRR